jgi:hypothetical protein
MYRIQTLAPNKKKMKSKKSWWANGAILTVSPSDVSRGVQQSNLV